jgi:hypothetical protein
MLRSSVHVPSDSIQSPPSTSPSTRYHFRIHPPFALESKYLGRERLIPQSTAKWPSRPDLYKAVHPESDNPGGAGIGSRSLYGKTAGFLVSPLSPPSFLNPMSHIPYPWTVLQTRHQGAGDTIATTVKDEVGSGLIIRDTAILDVKQRGCLKP